MPEFSKSTQITLAVAIPAGAIIAYWLYLKWTSDEDYDYDKRKVATSHSVRIKVLVPHKAVGIVIGKGGATIKKVQAETGARLNFNDRSTENDGKPRVLMISGTPEMAQRAEVMVYQIIAEIPEVLKEKIQVPHDCIGRIIGKGGVVIRDLRRASGVTIDIDKNQGKDDNGMKDVCLSGSRQQIDIVIDLIEEIVKKAEEEKHQKDHSKNTTSHGGSVKDGVKTGTRSPFQNAFVPREKGSIKATAIPVEESDLWDEFLDDDVIGVGTVNNNVTTDSAAAPTASDSYLQVMVSAVEHPGHFWVQHVGSQSLHLEELQKEVTHQLAFEDVRQNLAVDNPQPGDLVAAKFEEEDPIFYRAKVLAVADDGKVDLYFLDYGDNVFADLSKIYKLKPEFHAFPHQAIECQLANVEPIDANVGWTDEDITLFEDLVSCAQWKPLYAKVITHTKIGIGQGQGEGPSHQTELRPCLQLVDTSGEKDVDIAEELSKKGHAKKTSETNIKSDTSRTTLS